MPRLFPRLLAMAALVLLMASAQAGPRAKHVFIISIDGAAPAVVQKSEMPTLMTLVKGGAHSWNAQTILPSITLVSHTSMLTGVSPAKHGISWNDWLPEKGMLKVPTVFALAREKKLSTAMFVGKPKFIHLFLPKTVGEFSLPGYQSEVVASVAARYIEEKKPNLCFIHFADPDGAGHTYGWGSPEQIKAFARVDAGLTVVGRAIRNAGIADDSVVIITADHGGHAKTHGSAMPEDMTIPWVTFGKGVKPGFTITAPVTTYDTAATALWLLDVPIPPDWDGKPVTSAFQGESAQ